MPLSAFAHVWFFLFLIPVAGLVVLYLAVMRSRKQRLSRFADSEMIGSVSPLCSSARRWTTRALPVKCGSG